MSRGMLTLIALALSLPAAGCCLCASPYDYCGPTFTGECGEQCVTDARMGSVFSGPVPHAMSYEEVPAEAEEPSSMEQPSVDDSAPAPPEAPAEGELTDPEGYYPREEDPNEVQLEEPAVRRPTTLRQR